jgi:hypothetical protein
VTATTVAATIANSALALDRIRRRGELPIVLCIDVEPDGRTLDPDQPQGWDGFEEALKRLPAIRERLSSLTGRPANFSWFLRMDPQIEGVFGSAAWVVERWGSELDALRRQGDQLGLHTHDWRWSEELGEWVSTNLDPAWDVEVVELAMRSFREALGDTARAHRGGMHNVTPAMLGAFAAGGLEVDLTPEPGLAPQQGFEGERFVGFSPDWRLAAPNPYRTSPETFPAADPGSRAGPLLMPLASAPTRRGGRAPLALWSESPGFSGRLCLQLLRSTPPALVFVFRSDAPLKSQRWSQIVANLDHLARHRGVRFVTAGEAVAEIVAS